MNLKTQKIIRSAQLGSQNTLQSKRVTTPEGHQPDTVQHSFSHAFPDGN